MKKWEEFKQYSWVSADRRYLIDYSLLLDGATSLPSTLPLFSSAITEMKAVEQGEIANADEQRMVGHYWLRNPELSPSEEIRSLIETEIRHVQNFVRSVHDGVCVPAEGKKFETLLSVGIGGSALGPQLLAQAFCSPEQPMEFYSIDNTDPDGMALTLSRIPDLSTTLVLVVSKSGGTKETRNGMLVVEKAFTEQGLSFGKHAVAITGEGSVLFQKAKGDGWIDTFPMWDWVGGRTSLWSSVGLLPAALIGIDIEALLLGAKEMDEYTRVEDLSNNPAGILAHAWLQFSKTKDMVVLPYKDRLLLFSRYLQQLVMESIGKRLDRDGNIVEEGLSVYGNKGSTDQHAYVQQLRDGRNNFFAVFIEVLSDFVVLKGDDESLQKRQSECLLPVDDGVSAGDYLQGFYLGTREALEENGRSSISITIPELSAHSLGALIALFERAVSFYATYVNINAYHQPGVEAGKKAAERVLELREQILEGLHAASEPLSVELLASQIGTDERVHLFKILERLVSTGVVKKQDGATFYDARYTLEASKYLR